MGLFVFKLPELGEGIHEGEILKWHVKPGDQVEEDQVLVEVQNDKAVVEIPSPVKGTVKEVKMSEGTVGVVGDELLTFEVAGAGNAAVSAATQPPPPQEQVQPSPPAQPAVQAIPVPAAVQANQPPVGQSADKTMILATPSIRKLAREKSIDISQVKGTGPNGRITREDLTGFIQGAQIPVTTNAPQPAAATQTAASPESNLVAAIQQPTGDLIERVPLKGIRKIIAEAMVRSKTTAPHVTIMDEVDVSKLVAYRKRMKPIAEKKQIKVTYLPFVVKAVSGALRAFPALNASIDDQQGEILYKKFYNVGIATDTENGLMVPVVSDADRKSIWMIASEINQLAAKARDGKLAPQEMKNGTFTISNIGSAGGQFFTPVINYPEVAILGVGRISEKPIVKDGLVQSAQMMALSLSFDHRLIDGVTAQQFVNYLKHILEDPDLFIMEV